MNLICIICSDLIVPNSEIYSTKCGHLFHYTCLIQWIERSKTCPQCRNSATEKSIHRIYFTVANLESTENDLATWQNKCDNLQFQLMMKEKDAKNLTEKYNKVKHQVVTLRDEVSNLEGKTRTHDSIVHALKDQISYFKLKAKERDSFAEEITRLKAKLKQKENIDLVVNGSREEVTHMLKNENDIDSLMILVATLKKALLDAEKKKTNMEHKLKLLQNDLTKQKKEIACLELTNLNLRKDVEITKQKSPVINSGNTIDHSENMKINQNKSRLNLIDSPSLEEKTVNIINAKSPYLNLKQNSAFVDLGLERKSVHPLVGVKQISIFKKSKTDLSQRECSSSEAGVYNGLGGHWKEDLFPSSNSLITGFKRQRKDLRSSYTKFRKVDSCSFKK